MKIRTNNKPRHVIYGFELSDKEREQFDYYTGEELDNTTFFRYKGNVYDVGEFMAISQTPASPVSIMPDQESPLLAWHGAQPDSHFSGLVIKYCNDYEQVIVGQYFS